MLFSAAAAGGKIDFLGDNPRQGGSQQNGGMIPAGAQSDHGRNHKSHHHDHRSDDGKRHDRIVRRFDKSNADDDGVDSIAIDVACTPSTSERRRQQQQPRRRQQELVEEDRSKLGKILHGLIAKGTYVVAEYTADLEVVTTERDFTELCRKVLIRMPRVSAKHATALSRHAYVYASFTFSYVLHQDLTYLCVSSQSTGSETPFRFLAELRERYSRLFEEATRVPSSAESFQVELSAKESANSDAIGGRSFWNQWLRGGSNSGLRSAGNDMSAARSSGAIRGTLLLKDLIESFNNDGEDEYCASAAAAARRKRRCSTSSTGTNDQRDNEDHCEEGGYTAGAAPVATRVRRVERGLERTTDIMKENIGKVMQRGEQIDSLVNRTAVLSDELRSFRAASRQLKHRMLWRSYKSVVIVGSVVLAVVFLILYWLTGTNLLFFVFRTFLGPKAAVD